MNNPQKTTSRRYVFNAALDVRNIVNSQHINYLIKTVHECCCADSVEFISAKNLGDDDTVIYIEVSMSFNLHEYSDYEDSFLNDKEEVIRIIRGIDGIEDCVEF